MAPRSSGASVALPPRQTWRRAWPRYLTGPTKRKVGCAPDIVLPVELLVASLPARGSDSTARLPHVVTQCHPVGTTVRDSALCGVKYVPTSCSCRNPDCLASAHRPPKVCRARPVLVLDEEILAGWIQGDGGILCPGCGIARPGMEAGQRALREIFGDDYTPTKRRRAK
jgi:hypothetical protein